MRFRAGGILFSVEPEEALTEEDRTSIVRVDTGESGSPQTPVRLEIVAEPPWTSSDARLYPGRHELPVQRWENGRLLVSHHSFTAEIDPSAAWARLHRPEEHTYPLGVVIRTTMLARLPLLGGLPLHAAGVVLGEQAVGFFGPSGAGKTTLAETCPGTVLSDELVAVAPGEPPPWCARAIGARGGSWEGRRAPLWPPSWPSSGVRHSCCAVSGPWMRCDGSWTRCRSPWRRPCGRRLWP